MSARERMEAFVDAGVRSFVDLTETHEPLQPYEGLVLAIADERGLEIRYRRMPIRDRDVPAIERMREVLAHIDAEIAAGHPVYVHCYGGIGRTGMVVGCWIAENEGLSGSEALERIAALRAGGPDRSLRSPERDEQRQFVEAWQPASRERR